MTREQARTAIAQLNGLFPQANLSESETSLFLDTFQRFQLSAVIEALKAHRAKNDFPKPKISVLTAEIGPNGIDQSHRNRAPTYSQMLRRDLENGRVPTTAMGDAEVFLRVERWRFKHWQPKPTEAAKVEDSHVPALRREIISLLSSSGEFNPCFSLEDAERWADFTFTATDDEFNAEMLKLRDSDTRMGDNGVAEPAGAAMPDGMFSS